MSGTKTLLENLDKEVLIALVEAGFTADDIKAMSEPKVQYYAVVSNLDYNQLIETRDMMVKAGIMSNFVLSDITALRQNYSIELEHLLEVSMLILSKADTLGISDEGHNVWALATFEGYKRARTIATHSAALKGIKEEYYPENYAVLREAGIKHKAAIRLLKQYGENATALTLIDAYASTEESKKELKDNLCDFLDTATTPADYEHYLILTEMVSHEHALDVLNRSINSTRYLKVIDLGISHKNACTLLSLPFVGQMFYEDNGFRPRATFSLDQIVEFGNLDKRIQKIVLKFIDRLNARNLV